MKHTLLFVLMAMLSGCEQSVTERITLFESKITVGDDGLMHVVETIRVQVAGQLIKRGIYREILTSEGGRQFPIEVKSTKRDGKAIKAIVEDHSPRTRIRMVKQDGLLAHGEHEFQVSYTVRNRISHAGDKSSLKWNVTGPRWAFSIDRVRLSVVAPKDASDLTCSASTTSGTVLKAKEPKANERSFECDQKIKSGGSLKLQMEWRQIAGN